MHYRKLYSLVTGKLVPKSFDIHHIDGNRENNRIDNLVALPRKLHQQLHFFSLPEEFNQFPTLLVGNIAGSYHIIQMKNYLSTYEECSKWIDFKQHLLEHIPNFHNLNYE